MTVAAVPVRFTCSSCTRSNRDPSQTRSSWLRPGLRVEPFLREIHCLCPAQTFLTLVESSVVLHRCFVVLGLAKQRQWFGRLFGCRTLFQDNTTSTTVEECVELLEQTGAETAWQVTQGQRSTAVNIYLWRQITLVRCETSLDSQFHWLIYRGLSKKPTHGRYSAASGL